MTYAKTIKALSEEILEEGNINGPSQLADIFLGSICLISFILGVPLNLISLRFFIETRIKHSYSTPVQRFFGYTYAFIAITDCFICFTIIPLVEPFMNQRKSAGRAVYEPVKISW